MQIGVLGTGAAGRTIAAKLVDLGDIAGARGRRCTCRFWLRDVGGGATFNIKVAP